MKKRIRNKLLNGVLVFLISFFVYIRTLSPTVNWGDSGEFIVVSRILGIAHPTGYPLYTLFGKLFTLIPFASIAYKVNMMSAIFASLSCLTLFFILLKLTKNNLVAVFASLTFAFSYTFWSQALIAEVYTLQVLFIALLILLLLRWKETKDDKLLYLFSFVYGLSLCNHLVFSVILLPGFLYFIFVTEHKKLFKINFIRKYFTWKKILFMIALFIIGLLPYIYLPIRSFQNPSISGTDFTKIGNLIMHITGSGYSQYVFGLSFRQLFHRVIAFTYYLLIRELSFLGVIIGVFGIIYLLKENKILSISLLLMILTSFIFNIIYPINYSLDETWAWYIPIFLIFTIYFGIGLERVMSIIFGKKKRYKAMMILFLMLTPSIILLANFRNVDKSKYYDAYEYADNILKSVKDDAIIITRYSGDDTNTLLYMKLIESKRDDVYVDYYKHILDKVVSNTGQNINKQTSKETKDSILLDFMKRNIEKHPIYVINKDPKEVMKQKNFSGALFEIKQGDLLNQSRISNLFVY